MAKKRLKKYQMGDLFNSNKGITLDNPSLLTTGMGVSLTALPDDSTDNQTDQTLPKIDMPKLPSLNITNQPLVAKPMNYNKSQVTLKFDDNEKESSNDNSLFDMKRYAMLNMANSALSSFTSGINDRRLKKSAIQNSQFNLPYTPLGSDTNKYGYYRMGGLRPYAQGGFINYYENAYDADENADEYDNYNYEEENVADEERLTEDDVEAMQQEEQAKLEEQQRLIQKQQRRERMLKFISSMRENSRARIMGDDNEDNGFSTSYGMASIPQDRGEQFNIIKEAADKHGVPASILAGVYGAETGFGKHATMVSSTGAQGPFQFMPGTAAQYGVNPWDFNSAADGAARLLRDNFRTFGSWDKAVAAYNAGPGNIKKGIIPAETRAYVPKVMSYANVFSQQGFRDGGELQQYQTAGQYPRPTTSDSLALYKNTVDLLNHFENKKAYKSLGKSQIHEYRDVTKENMGALEDMKKRLKNKKEHPYTARRWNSNLNVAGNLIKGVFGMGLADVESDGLDPDYDFKISDYYQRQNNPYQYKMRELYNNLIDTEAPMAFYDTRIKPTIQYEYQNVDYRSGPIAGSNPLLGDIVNFYGYDPILIKPSYLKTQKDWEYVKKKYPQLSNQKTTPPPPSRTQPIPPKPPVPPVVPNRQTRVVPPPIVTTPTLPPQRVNTHPIQKMSKLGMKNKRVNIKGVPLKIPQSSVTLNFNEDDFNDEYQTPRFAIYDQQGNLMNQGNLPQTTEFQKGGTRQNPPITYTQEQYNNDPVLRQNIQNYSDSLNLYKAYQFQKQNVKVEPMLKDMVQLLNQNGENTTVNELRTTRKNNFGNNQIAKNKMLNGFSNFNKFKRENFSGLDPMVPEYGDNKIYNYYKSLEFNQPVFAAKYSSPDLVHKTIKPIDVYFDGIAYSPIYKQPVQPYIEHRDVYLTPPDNRKRELPYLKSVPFINNKNTFAPAQKLNIPTPQIEYAPVWETKVYDTPAYRKEWKEKVMKPVNVKFAQGGNINKTGYTPGYKSFNNPYNIIPSTDITMENTPFPVLGIDASGYTQMMKPGGNYSFMKAPVLEIPAYKSFMQGGYNQQQPIYNMPNYVNGGSLGSISPMTAFPPAARKSTSPKTSSLKQFKRGDVYYVDSATLANLKTANVKYKYI